MFVRTMLTGLALAGLALAQPPARPMMASRAIPFQTNQLMVRAEVTIVCVHPETLKSLELWQDDSGDGEKCFLSSCQARKVLETIKADDRCEVLGSPALLLFDSQNGMVNVASENGGGYSFSITPRVSLDHRFIQMAISAEHKEVASCCQVRPCKAGDDSDRVQRTTVQLHQCNSVVSVPTGKSVMWEVSRPKTTMRCDLTLGSFFQAEVVASKERHVCVMITPSEQSEASCQPMPPMCGENADRCQVVTPAPTQLPCPVARAMAFVPAQEQSEPVPPAVNPQLEKLLAKYEQACEDGDMAKARKFAKRCLDIDPTCFMRDR